MRRRVEKPEVAHRSWQRRARELAAARRGARRRMRRRSGQGAGELVVVRGAFPTAAPHGKQATSGGESSGLVAGKKGPGSLPTATRAPSLRRTRCRSLAFFFRNTEHTQGLTYTRAHVHPYERTYAHPTLTSTSDRLSQRIELEIDEVTTDVSLSTGTSPPTEQYTA